MKIVNPMFDPKYKGSKGVELSDKQCELYDDMPYVPLKERVAKAIASGQVLDDLKYFQVVPDSFDKIDDIDKLRTSLDDCDYACDFITNYKIIKEKRIKRQREFYANLKAKKEVKNEVKKEVSDPEVKNNA